MKAQFKEKTYENYFQSELARLTNLCFAPDQIDESVLGFDGAFYIPYNMYPGVFPYVRRARRGHLLGMTASDIKDIGDEINSRLPPFNLNLFIQYKRPEYMSHSNASEWALWGKPYYRFEIQGHQQQMLQQIAVSAHGRAAVVYASPAFWKNEDLFVHAQKGGIVENSNISEAGLMAGHERFTYSAAGHFGIGHSEPEHIESEPLTSILRRGVDNQRMSFTQHMKDLDRLIRGLLERDELSRTLWNAARASLRNGLGGDAISPTDTNWLDAIDSIVAFGLVFDVRVTSLCVTPETGKVRDV